ncbi:MULTISPECIES: hypothetical protein [Burkholderia cepacia complex]|uniref:hypothetical protein n=1 Tax=Burkholderia cepacia complex TaxID=87882 RepID=UPI00158DAD0F|nr:MULTISPECIES: hypothetical protein [Burkholderia cepacia complex]MCA8160534.1 hypothetical protein [Burkholderia cepacia]
MIYDDSGKRIGRELTGQHTLVVVEVLDAGAQNYSFRLLYSRRWPAMFCATIAVPQ